MSIKFIPAIVALWLTACGSADKLPLPDPYVGGPVSKLAMRFGPPTAEVDSGDDRRTFLWVPSASGVPTADQLGAECRLSVIAHTQYPPAPGLASWVVDSWQYNPENGATSPCPPTASAHKGTG